MLANKILVICGPTATGKTQLALKLASLFKGELISADSRQVYKGMDIGTGKDLPVNFKLINKSIGYYTNGETKIWGYDLVNPDEDFSVAEFIKFAIPLLEDLWRKNKLPIIVGGTGLYIKALLGPLDLIQIPPNKKLRQKLNKFSINSLQEELKKISQSRWKQMNWSDSHNPRRLVRAIEIILWKINNHAIPDLNRRNDIADNNILLIGLIASKEELTRRIHKRIETRISLGIVKEIGKLLKNGYGWDLPSMSGLGYREWREYFEKINGKGGKIDEIIKQWEQKEVNYAKRQLTWFKKDKKINWYEINKENYQQDIINQVKKWYTEI